MLLCAGGSYYTGITVNLRQRLIYHASGTGSRYTKGRKPKALVWVESHRDRSSAAKREFQLKRWSHAKKKALATGELRFKGAAQCVWVSLDSATALVRRLRSG